MHGQMRKRKTIVYVGEKYGLRWKIWFEMYIHILFWFKFNVVQSCFFDDNDNDDDDGGMRV